MFAVGHMALAYLLGKGSSKALGIKINIPVLLVLSILPDIDILYDFITGAEIHRGPTHSILVAIAIFIPIFVIYRKKAIPYFLALVSHSLIGDFFIGGKLQLLWPVSTKLFGLHELGSYYINITSPINIVAEILLFIAATLVLYKTKDWKVFFSANLTNLVLIIPVATVLLPSTIGYPFDQPLLLTQPTLALAHIFYLALFSIAIIETLIGLFRKRFHASGDAVEDSGKKKDN